MSKSLVFLQGILNHSLLLCRLGALRNDARPWPLDAARQELLELKYFLLQTTCFFLCETVREALLKFTQQAFGHCRKGGVSTLARMVWGNFFGKKLLDFGVS